LPEAFRVARGRARNKVPEKRPEERPDELLRRVRAALASCRMRAALVAAKALAKAAPGPDALLLEAWPALLTARAVLSGSRRPCRPS